MYAQSEARTQSLGNDRPMLTNWYEWSEMKNREKWWCHPCLFVFAVTLLTLPYIIQYGTPHLTRHAPCLIGPVVRILVFLFTSLPVHFFVICCGRCVHDFFLFFRCMCFLMTLYMGVFFYINVWHGGLLFWWKWMTQQWVSVVLKMNDAVGGIFIRRMKEIVGECLHLKMNDSWCVYISGKWLGLLANLLFLYRIAGP